MELRPVGSSNIEAMGHDPATSTLRVRFNSGDEYEYYDVSEGLYQELLNAPSVGTAFSSRVKKGGFRWAKAN